MLAKLGQNVGKIRTTESFEMMQAQNDKQYRHWLNVYLDWSFKVCKCCKTPQNDDELCKLFTENHLCPYRFRVVGNLKNIG